MFLGRPRFPEQTDRTKWRLEVNEGRQVWIYDATQKTQTLTERYFLGLDTSAQCPPLPRPTSAMESVANALSFYKKIQTEVRAAPVRAGGAASFARGRTATGPMITAARCFCCRALS